MPVVGFKGELELAKDMHKESEESETRLEHSTVCNSDIIPSSKISYMSEDAKQTKGYVFEELKQIFGG